MTVKVKNARAAARKAAEESRNSIAVAGERARDVRESGHYSDEGVAEYVGSWVSDARKKSGAALERAEKQAADAREKAEKAYHDARSVSAEERAAAAAVLAPVIAANTDPEALIRAYEKRAPNSQAERFVLEDAISVVQDADIGGVAFAETWERTCARTEDAVTTPEERAAAEDLGAVEELEGYLASVRTVSETDLEGIESGSGPQFGIQLETARYTIGQYERRYKEAEESRGTVVNEETGETEGDIIRAWRAGA
jgi:hypothetical protein